jgi:hypothetical protein
VVNAAPAVVPPTRRRRIESGPHLLYGTALVLCAIALGVAAIQHVRAGAGASAPRSRS